MEGLFSRSSKFYLVISMIAIIQLNLSPKKWVFIPLVLNIRICISQAVLSVSYSVDWNLNGHRLICCGRHIEFTVGPIQGGGAHKVRASGNGLIRGEVNSISTMIIRRIIFAHVCSFFFR